MANNLYKTVSPEHLQKTVPDGYYLKTLQRDVLEIVLEDVTSEEAEAYIKENLDELLGEVFVLLPVIKVEYDWESK